MSADVEPQGDAPAHVRRLHGSADYLASDRDALWAAFRANETITCRACSGAITVDDHEGQPLWRRAWPTIRCEKGCTLLEATFHVNLWPDV